MKSGQRLERGDHHGGRLTEALAEWLLRGV
jgi:hypothetical protein